MAEVHQKEFKKAIRGISDLNAEDRRYAEDVFKKSLRGGLSSGELKREISRLNRNTKDTLTRDEVRKIERDLAQRIKE
jgi:hypothetical protein